MDRGWDSKWDQEVFQGSGWGLGSPEPDTYLELHVLRLFCRGTCIKTRRGMEWGYWGAEEP